MNPSLEFSQKFVVGYNAACKPLCQELKLPQTALDILLFLVNNPEYKTASDIVEVRKLTLSRSMWTASCRRVTSGGRPWQVTAARPCSSGRKRPAPW